MKVLIVEDDKSSARILEKWLGGYDVSLCESLPLAWKLLSKDEDPHLIILDAHLHKEDGAKLLLHPKLQTGKIRVMLYTSDTRLMTPDVQSELLYKGADVVLLKPLTIDLLEANVWRLCKISETIRRKDNIEETGQFPIVSLTEALRTKGIFNDKRYK